MKDKYESFTDVLYFTCAFLFRFIVVVYGRKVSRSSLICTHTHTHTHKRCVFTNLKYSKYRGFVDLGAFYAKDNI